MISDLMYLGKSKEVIPSETIVLMPVGGQATRARPVTNDEIPKHLIPLGDKTVLDVVCENLISVGFRNFVFCVGHHQDKIRRHVEEGDWAKIKGVNYIFSEESTPLGVDGSILNAISTLNLDGQGMIVPGDIMLPWEEVAVMDQRHSAWASDITVSVTGYTTERSADVGKMIVEDGEADRILWCYSRDDPVIDPIPGSRVLTCAAATSINIQSYKNICQEYLAENLDHGDRPLSLRDNVIPWATRTGSYTIHAYDIKGEVLDLGIPSNIYYGQKNWAQYV